jgi:hypothetical protein
VAALRPGVWLGDAIRALAVLPELERRALIASLGFEEMTAAPAPAAPPTPDREPSTVIRDREPPTETPVGPLVELLDPVERVAPRDRPTVPSRVATGVVAQVRHQPLLTPGPDVRLLRTAFARPRASRVLDLRQATERIARLLPLVPVPWERRWGLHVGSQLLLDVGAGLQPFAADRADVVRAARRVVGRGALRVLNFRQVPTRPAGAGLGPVWTWRPYRLPLPRTPVMVVTDLGLAAPLTDAAPAAPFEWAEFFDALAKREIVPVILLPYAAARAPAALRRRAVVVTWDRDARAQRVRWMLRNGLRRIQ